MVKRHKLIREIPVWEMDRTTDTLEIVVPSEMAKELRELVNAYLWEPDEGLRTILGAGMAALEAQRLLQEDSGSSEEVKLRHLTRQLVRSEGRLAATRYRLFEAEEEIKRVVFSNAGLRELGMGMDKAITRQIAEIEKLKQELKEKHEEIEALNSQLSLELQGKESVPPSSGCRQRK